MTRRGKGERVTDGPVRRSPNMYDVAARAGVSHQTVSRVVNGFDSIRPETRDRVLVAIAELGYRQNVAARALATSPALLLADEPSGNLDVRNAEQLHSLFAGLAREFHTAVVVVTHERDVARFTSLEVTLSDGRIVGDHARAMAVSA